MPYIDADKRKLIHTAADIQNVGDLNYFITVSILREWNKQPSYRMIHVLRLELVTSPKDCPLLNELRRVLSDRFSVADIYTAAALAFAEFYRRIGTKYEKSKIEANGDLPEYVQAIEAIKGAEPKLAPQPYA